MSGYRPAVPPVPLSRCPGGFLNLPGVRGVCHATTTYLDLLFINGQVGTSNKQSRNHVLRCPGTGDKRTGQGRDSSVRVPDEREWTALSPGASLNRRMEQANDKTKRRRVPNKGSWKPGQSGNPGGGRPRSGLALATTIRERIDPNEVLDLVTRYLADENVPLQDRLDTLLPWLHAGYLKPPQTSALHVTGDADQLAARSFEHLSDDELRERLEWIKGVRRELTDGEPDQDPPTSD